MRRITRHLVAGTFFACLLAVGAAPAFPNPDGGGARGIAAGAPDTWVAHNEIHGLRVVFSPGSARFGPLVPDGAPGDGVAGFFSRRPAWSLDISLRRHGPAGEAGDAGAAAPRVGPDFIDFVRRDLIERFINQDRGLTHELFLEVSPGSAPAVLDFAISGTLVPKVSEEGRNVEFATASGEVVLLYRDLRAVDADSREVDARWERIEADGDAGGLRLVIQAADHALPIVVGGRFVTPKGTPRGVPESEAAGGVTATWPVGQVAIAPLAVPTNDECWGAEVIPGAGPFPHLSGTYDLTDATTAGDPPLPTCQANVSRSLWFRFTPAAGGSYTFSLCAGAPTGTTLDDTVLAVYEATGDCAGLVEIPGGCDDDSCSATDLQSVVADVDLAAGTTYYAVAWKYGATAPAPGAGAVQLLVAQNPPPGPAPPNDRCQGAEIIPSGGPFPYLTSVTPDIGGATTAGDPPAPYCQPSVSRSTWYRFTPTVGGRYTFSVCADAPTASTVDDTVMAIYAGTGDCSGLTQTSGGCDDDSCLGEVAQSVVRGIELTAGTGYYVVVWQYGTAPPAAWNTAVQLRVSQVLAPENDTCASVPTLLLDAPVDGTTVSAADDYRLPAGSACFSGPGQTATTAPGGDVVWVFTAPTEARYSFRMSGFETAKNAVLYVAADCPAGPAPAVMSTCLGAANRNAGYPAEEVACLHLNAGRTVYVYADEAVTTAGSALRIEVNRCLREAEPNDTPAAAGVTTCGLEGAINPAGDADLFSLGTVAAGSRVFAMVDGAAANSTDFDARVTTTGDTLEYDDLNNDTPFGSVSPNLAGTPLTGSAAFLRMSHYNAAAPAEPYRLFAAVQPSGTEAAPEIEPNDTLAGATQAPGLYYAGALSSPGDVDVYAVPGVAGDLLFVALDLDPGRDNTPFNGTLALLDPRGFTLIQVNDGGATSSVGSGAGSLVATSPHSPAEAIAWRASRDGTHYVRVGLSSGLPGDYLLSVAPNCLVGAAVDRLDVDGDGVANVDDCAPRDPDAWSVPSEATDLRIGTGNEPDLLQWSAPVSAGGAAVSYDLVRATRADDFTGGMCVAGGLSTLSTSDTGLPTSVFYYLVRVRNHCGGTLGTGSDGTPRLAPGCP